MTADDLAWLQLGRDLRRLDPARYERFAQLVEQTVRILVEPEAALAAPSTGAPPATARVLDFVAAASARRPSGGDA